MVGRLPAAREGKLQAQLFFKLLPIRFGIIPLAKASHMSKPESVWLPTEKSLKGYTASNKEWIDLGEGNSGGWKKSFTSLHTNILFHGYCCLWSTCITLANYVTLKSKLKETFFKSGISKRFPPLTSLPICVYIDPPQPLNLHALTFV